MNEPITKLVLPPEPFRLPRFTFLLGPSDGTAGAKELATAIADRDEDLGIFDFEEPLRRATFELFFGGFNTEIDLASQEERNKHLPIDSLERDEASHVKSVEDWLTAFRTGLVNNVSSDILARIAIADYERTGPELGIYDRYLWRDATEVEVRCFVRRFSGEKCCCIHLGPLNTFVGTSAKHLWLPELSLDFRLAALTRELNT